MRVFEAAGSGLQNHDLINNVLGVARFTVNSGSVTANSANRGLGLAAATSASGLFTLTWNASAFGTASAPNIQIIGGQAAADAIGIGCVSAVATSGALLRLGNLKVAATATAAVTYEPTITAATPFNVLVFPYSATGTQFTFVTT